MARLLQTLQLKTKKIIQMRKIAIYGKGGIGKSTTTQNTVPVPSLW